MTTKQIITEPTPKSTIIHLSRPAKRNALSPSMLHDFITAVQAASPSKPLFLASTSDIFCSGLDLEYLNDIWNDKQRLEQYFKSLHDLYLAVYAHPAPTVAIVQKGVYGGGFGLACCCDSIPAGRDCRFVLPGNRFGNLARLARPPLMTKLEAIELEDMSAIDLNWKSAHTLGICEELNSGVFNHIDTFFHHIHIQMNKRLETNSQLNFARLCKQVRTLVFQNIDISMPPAKWPA